VYSANLTRLTVLEQQGDTFTCEPEIEAEIGFDLDVAVEDDDFVPYPSVTRHSISVTKVDYFYPEVIVRFDRSTGELEFESVSLGSIRSIRVESEDLDR